ncbi:DNA cytosine methyltransferase [Alphaproteobacteria bacterium]|nr:DNA cytosine methyltransferase [Alphaproteobacteria bacterium]
MAFVNYWLNENYKYNFIDLFCGSGGLSLGFSRALFKCELALDFEKSCIETFSYNHPNIKKSRIICDDIHNQTKKNWDNLKYLKNKIDVLCGGPPCQGFSTANRQPLIDDPRNKLYKQFIKSVEFFKPTITLMENVSGIYNKKDEIISDFKTIGYDGICLKLNAEDFNIPQRRRRVFFIMYNQDKLKFDLNSFSSMMISLINSKKTSSLFKLKDAIFDLPKLQAKNIKNNTELENDLFGYFKCSNTSEPSKFVKFINNSSEKFPYIYNHKTRYNNERDIKIFSLLKQGEDSSSESIKHLNPYKNRENIFKDKFYKLKEDDVSKTITAHMKFDCHMYIHPNQARGLTPREAARIQTYPDSYVFKGPLTKWYLQIGNSVPPVLAYNLALSIKELLDGN